MNRVLFRYFPLTVNNHLLFIYIKLLSYCFKFFKKKKIYPTVPKKILLIHLGHLGDIILLLKVAERFKRTYPLAELGVLSGSWNQEALAAHPDIHFLHHYDHFKNNRTKLSFIKKIYRSYSSFFRALKEITKTGYDISIDCSLFFPNSHLLCYLADISTRVGFISGGAGDLLNIQVSLTEEILPIEKDLLHLLEPLGIVCEEGGRQETYQSKKKDTWIFHPFSGDEKKNLQEDFWKKLYKFFDTHGKDVMFTGKSLKEKAAIDAILEGKNLENNVCGKYSLIEIEKLTQQVEGIVCVDTFICHLAAKKNTRIFVQFNHPLHMIRWCPEHAYSICHRKDNSYENDHLSGRVWDKTF